MLCLVRCVWFSEQNTPNVNRKRDSLEGGGSPRAMLPVTALRSSSPNHLLVANGLKEQQSAFVQLSIT
jgi:hypothetical protein